MTVCRVTVSPCFHVRKRCSVCYLSWAMICFRSLQDSLWIGIPFWTYVIGYEKRVNFVQNAIFWHFQTVTVPRPKQFQASHLVYKQYRPFTSQIQRLKLQQASCPKRWAAKVRHKMTFFEHDQCKDNYVKFQVHSCCGSRDISVLKWKFGKCTKLTLFSYPVTYNTRNNWARVLA